MGGQRTDILGRPDPMTGPRLIPLWFVRDLMVVVLFSPVIYWLVKKFGLFPVAIFGVCYVTRLFVPIHGFSTTAFLWFSLGSYFAIHKLNMVEGLYRLRYPAYIVAIVAMIVLVWHNGRDGDGIHPNAQWVQVLHYVYIVAAVISVVAVAANLLRGGRVKVNRWLARASFFVFLAHPFIVGYVWGLFNHIVPEDMYPLMMVEYIICPFVTVAVCLAIYKFMECYTPRILALLTGGRVSNKAIRNVHREQ